MIIARDLKKYYRNGKVEVLKGISLEIIDGSFTVILGASGSGKSTLLSVLSGLESPDEGMVSCNGEELTLMTEKERTDFRKRTVGFVFQQYYLLPHLTVDKNVRLGANLVKNNNYEELIKGVGLWDKRNSKPSELSGGEQQRVSIARALAKKPKLLFLDEPTGALDEETGRSVLDYIFRMKQAIGFTAVMVTHNVNIAETADTIIYMNSGKISECRSNPIPKSVSEIGW